MFARPFCLDRLLDELAGTTPFAEFCHSRGIRDPSLALPNGGCLRHRWQHAITGLSAEAQARIKLDLAAVAELGDEDGTQALLATADGRSLPPDEIDAGAVLALWFLSREPAIFRSVFLRHEVRQKQYWRDATGPRGLIFENIEGTAQKLADGLASYFRKREGIGRFAAAEAVEDGGSIVFHVWVGDRARSVVTIADDGHATSQRVQPAKRLLFVYRSKDGAVRLASPVRTRERVTELLEQFGRILGGPVVMAERAYQLDSLKYPFRPVLDGSDMESVRVKSLHLRYPDRQARRVVKLVTPANDRHDAIEELLHFHSSCGLEALSICYAELTVRMRVDGQSKNYSIQLWPERSNLGQTPFGERLQHCLQRWNLTRSG